MAINQEFLDQSEKDTWETPEDILEVIQRHVDIDLDPCAGPDTEIGNMNYRGPAGWVDGLNANWFGYVWLNMPFSEKGKWIEKAIRAYKNGEIKGVIILTPDSTDVKSWWHELLVENCHSVWFSEGRIKYIDPETGEEGGSPTFGTALNFIGEFPTSLFHELSQHGDMCYRHAAVGV